MSFVMRIDISISKKKKIIEHCNLMSELNIIKNELNWK